MAFVTAALLAPCGVAPWRPLPSSGRRGANKGRSSRSAARPAVLRRAAEGDKALAAEQAAAAAPPAPAPVPADAPIKPAVGGKGLLAGGAVGLGVALFLAARLTVGGPSFAALEAGAVPLDAALSNGRPTVLEFYAGGWDDGGGPLVGMLEQRGSSRHFAAGKQCRHTVACLLRCREAR